MTGAEGIDTHKTTGSCLVVFYDDYHGSIILIE